MSSTRPKAIGVSSKMLEQVTEEMTPMSSAFHSGSARRITSAALVVFALGDFSPVTGGSTFVRVTAVACGGVGNLGRFRTGGRKFSGGLSVWMGRREDSHVEEKRTPVDRQGVG